MHASDWIPGVGDVHYDISNPSCGRYLATSWIESPAVVTPSREFECESEDEASESFTSERFAELVSEHRRQSAANTGAG